MHQFGIGINYSTVTISEKEAVEEGTFFARDLAMLEAFKIYPDSIDEQGLLNYCTLFT